MRKKLLTVGVSISAFIVSTMIVIDLANAGGMGRKGNPPKAAPEPISCVLFAAGGGTLVGLRYLRNRRKLKESKSQGADMAEGIPN